MKRTLLSAPVLALMLILLFSGCSPVSMTSWVNPKEHEQVSKIAVWGMFDKLEFQKPFEQTVAKYLNDKGIKAIEALSIIAPNKKYHLAEL